MITSIEELISGIITDGLLENNEPEMALKYILSKYENDQNGAINILEENVSKKGNHKNTVTKLFMLSVLYKNKTDLINSVVNKQNLIINLDKDDTVVKNSTGVMDALNSIFTVKDLPLFKQKENISKIANSYSTNKKSLDSLNTIIKQPNIDISTCIKITNAFK